MQSTNSIITLTLAILVSTVLAAQQDNILLSIKDRNATDETAIIKSNLLREIDLPGIQKNIAPVQNLFIITLDGFRWQELFNGAIHPAH